MKKAFYIIVSLLAAVSCADVNVEPEPQDNPEISLNVSSLSFLNSGEAIDGASVVVESSAGWALIGRTDWCHPSVTEGTSGETVTFTADVNSGADSRTTEFSFVCGSKTVKLHVMQKQTDAIELYKDEFSIPASGGQIVVRASATDEVSVNIPDEYSGWIELASDSGTASAASGNVVTKGMDLNVFYFNINETDKYNAREGRIAFTSGANTVWAEISQDKKIELSVDNASYSVGPDGGTVTVTVRTNLPYSVDVPQTTSSWLTPNLDPDSSEAPDDLVTRTEKFVAGPQSEMSRAGRITLTSLEGNLTTTFFIIQKGSSPKVIEIQDENFRKALDELAFVITEGYTDTRCELSDLGQNSTEMNVSGKNIRSIDGISNFPNVTTLDCSNNLITVLDLRGTNVWSAYGTGSKIYGNPLEEIHGGDSFTCVQVDCSTSNSGQPGFGLIGSDGTASKKLRVTGNQIQYVYVQYNPYLEKLDISSCPKMNSVYMGGFTGCGTYNPPFRVYFPTGTYIPSYGIPANTEYIAGPPTDW